MHCQSTKMVAISTLLAFSTVVNGAAHLRPYQHEADEIEARDPQFGGFGGFLSQLSSAFAGFTLPSVTLPSLTTTTSSKATVVTTTSSKATTTSTTVVTSSSATLTQSVKTTVSAVSSAATKASSTSSCKAASTSTASTKTGQSSSSASTASSKTGQTSSSASVATSKTGQSSSSSSLGAASSKTGQTSSSASVATSKRGSPSSSVGVVASKTASSASSAGTATSKAAQSSASAGKASSWVASRSSSVASASASNKSACPAPRRSRSSKISGSSAKTSSKVASTSTSASISTTSAVSPITTSSATISSSASISLIGPSVTVSNGVVVGTTLPGGIQEFLGIPYAQPPVGSLRLKPPVALTSSFGTLNATGLPPSCPQMAQQLTGNYSAGGLQPLINEFIFTPTVQQEDCLTLSIFRPNTTTPLSSLPVLFWIYGGGFEFGATAMYNGTNIVARSVSLGAPVIFVEVNYRLGGFGFLAGADLAAETSTNLGLRDQRLGLQWVADNIAAFGGDPTKVTLWGESAGAISSCFQTTVNGGNNLYNGKALFRGTIHNSGCIAPADNVTAPQAQAIYDTVVANAGCSASTAAARLACLRAAPFDVLHNATNSVPGFGSYRSVDLSYLPRPDTGDTFFAQTAEISIAAGEWTKTPFIIGDQQDEGTLFAIVLNNITNTDQLITYLASWFPGNPNSYNDTAGLVALYPDDPADGQPEGSPYNTAGNNNVFPEYKRIASILGDIVFIITRRAFLNLGTGQGVKAWTYISSYLTGLPTYGTLHGSDLAYNFDSLFVNVLPTVQQQSYYISFVNYLDPNALNSTTALPSWPAYTQSAPILVNFTGGDIAYGNDTFRQPVYDYLLSHMLSFRI